MTLTFKQIKGVYLVVLPAKKFFRKLVKSQVQDHEVKNFGIDRKVSSQGIHLCNIKALSSFVKKLWSRLCLLWTDRQTDGQTDKQTDRVRLRGYN